MQLTPGRYRFDAPRSRARVIAHAPGHRFTADGLGIEGDVELGSAQLLAVRATFPLKRLSAGDPLGNRELKKFLGLDAGPIAQAEILGPIALVERSGVWTGDGRLSFSIGTRAIETTLHVEGAPPSVRATLSLTFTGLGYEPPKLLFFKVKDRFDVEIEGALFPAT